jgi:hypothetical protein
VDTDAELEHQHAFNGVVLKTFAVESIDNALSVDQLPGWNRSLTVAIDAALAEVGALPKPVITNRKRPDTVIEPSFTTCLFFETQ